MELMEDIQRYKPHTVEARNIVSFICGSSLLLLDIYIAVVDAKDLKETRRKET